DTPGPPDERGVRGAAVRRRLAEHDDDGDPGEGTPAEAAARPQARRPRLPPADDVRQARRVAAAGSFGVLPADEAAGEGDRGPGDRDQPAEPWSGTAHRQAPDAV